MLVTVEVVLEDGLKLGERLFRREAQSNALFLTVAVVLRESLDVRDVNATLDGFLDCVEMILKAPASVLGI